MKALHWTLLLLVVVQYDSSSAFVLPSFSDIKTIVGYVFSAGEKLYSAYGFIEGQINPEPSLREILNAVNDISRSIDQMGAKLENKINEAVQILLQRLPLVGKVNAALRDLHNYIVRVDTLYIDYESYSSKLDRFNNDTIKRFINTVTSHDPNNLYDVLGKMHRLIAPGRTGSIKTGLFWLLHDYGKGSEIKACDTNESAQQYLWQLYGTLLVTEMRAHIMLCFGYLQKGLYEKGNYKAEVEKSADRLVARAKDYLSEVKQAMKGVSREIRRCDPTSHIRGETYVEFTGFMQGMVISNQHLNPEGNCRVLCERYPGAAAAHRQWILQPIDQFSPKKACRGSLGNCQTPAWGKWEICAYLQNDSARRYAWLKDPSGSVYGEQGKCSNGSLLYPSRKGWFMQSCAHCRCDCTDDNWESDSHRLISFRPQLSDTNKNKVVSNVRIIKTDKVIQVQIKEGTLLPEGRVESKTAQWKKLERFDVRGGYISLDRYATLGINSGTQYEELKYLTDYGALRWNQKRFNLDDVMAPADYVVTGIRFGVVNPNTHLKQSIEILIHVTKFDWKAGKLLPKAGQKWLHAADMGQFSDYKRERAEIGLNNRPGNPTSSVNPLDSTPNTFVDVRMSGWKEDAAQTTLPLLDAQPAPGPLDFPLAGVGMYHKGASNVGGFIALRVFSIDIPPYIDDALPPKAAARYKATLAAEAAAAAAAG